MDNSWWDDFSNNLATDLAPLIALFGEAATKQYLSECLTVEDIVIFAVAPLGVITAVVSAIRVCGTPSLRAFVGRAQEGAGTAEAELCSSTSRDVCELYSNGGIARVFGRPKLLEIVHDTRAGRDEFYPHGVSEATAGIYSFPEYIKTQHGREEWKSKQKSLGKRRNSVGSNESGHVQQKKAIFAPNPNLSLNIGIRPHNRLWFLAAATLGVILQLFILVWAALTRYYFRWLRNGREDQYSVPLTVIGTILLCLGMAECAHLIESKTKEQIYERAAPVVTPSRMYWVQPGNQSIGDQIFDSFAYSDSKQPLQKYITSWKDTTNRPSTMVSIWTAVITTSIGFICQFLGLRASHSSVAIAQLGVTIFMSAIRAGLRSQRLRTEDNFMADAPDFYEGHELDCLALKLVQQQSTEVKPSSTEVQYRPLWRVFNSISKSSIPQKDHATSVDNVRGSRILERLSVKYGPSTMLAGFRIQSKNDEPMYPFEKSATMAFYDHELIEWMSAEYCSECKGQCVCRENPCKRDPSAAVKAFLYRARLSRMTGIEGPKSTLSSYWGEEFVNVRSISLALSDAIEETMRILFSSEGSSPVVLHKPWEDACSIFWAVQCSLIDASTSNHEESIIHMSLKRSINEYAAPEGPWRVNRSEIEAVLGLWMWSLKETRKRNDVLEDVDEKKALQRISRILFIGEKDTVMSDETAELNDWRESGGVKIRQARLEVQYPITVRMFEASNDLELNNIRYPLQDTTDPPDVQNAVWGGDRWEETYVTRSKGPPPGSRRQYRFFGWYGSEQSPQYNEVLCTDSPNSLLGNCALELYSSFLSAVMHAVEDIGGETHLEEQQDKLTVRNQTIQSIQATLIQNSLCNAGDAFACIIPILKRQDKLPVPNEIVSRAIKIAYKHSQRGNWWQSKELMAWISRRSKVCLVSAYNQQDPTKRLNAINDFRLSFIEICEASRQTLLQDDETPMIVGLQGIIQLLERYSADETIKNIPLVWHDVGNVPDNQARTGQPPSLADTLICYGVAVSWLIRYKNFKSYIVVERYLHQLDIYTSSKEVANSPEQALQRSDLGSLFYFLQSPTLRESIQLTNHFLFKAMIAASEKGWFMVINHLVEHGAAIDQEDDNGRTALSYAAELGDINTANTLMDLGACLRNRNNDDQHRKLAIHFAAKQGHATIIRHMLKSFSGSSDLDYEDEEGMTPLSWAITSGNAATVLELTREGSSISPNAYDTKKPALHLAIQEDKEEIVDVLLRSEKVDPNHTRGETIDSPPLIHALRLRKEVIFDKLLDSARIDVGCTDMSGRTAIWWSVALGLDTYVHKLLDSKRFHKPLARELYDLHKADRNGYTPLSMAAEGGRIAIVRQLRRIEGAGFAIKPIIIAAMKGHIAVVEELLASKFDREDTKSLLEANELGHVWIQIQQSKLWEDEDGERLRIPSVFKLQSVKDSELTFAEDLYNQPYEKLV